MVYGGGGGECSGGAGVVVGWEECRRGQPTPLLTSLLRPLPLEEVQR